MATSWTWIDPPPGLSKRRIGVLALDVHGRDLNVITDAVLGELDERLGEVAVRRLEGVIVTSRRDDFLAGADVDLIASVASEAEGQAKSAAGQRILRRLSTLGVPTVAAIHGACVGGGAELACWCTARTASLDDRTRIGFPEVQLGIVPGFGGTQRLPRIVGLAQALALATTGRQLGPLDALKVGLVDSVVPREHLLAEAATLVDRAHAGTIPRRRSLTNAPLVRDVVAWQARRAVLAATAGRYPAALEIVRLCRLAVSTYEAFGLAEEARTLGRLLAGGVSQSLLHLYQARRTAERGGTPPPKGALAGVVGAGVMGAGIAGVAAGRGFRARLSDLDAAGLARGVGSARETASRSKRRSVRRAAAMTAAADRVSGTLALDGLAEADLVVEAIVERSDPKMRVLAEAERASSEATLLATNTSSLSVDELAKALARPERFVGLHFFNPVEKMPLVEIVRGRASSEESVQRAIGWAKALGKVPVVVGDAPGFLVNRLLMPYLAEAFALLDEGNAIDAIDRAAVDFGMPMGPFRLLDEVGLDVALEVSRTFARAFPDRFGESALLGRMVAEGRLGRKSGRGFYEKRGRKWAPWSGLPRPAAKLDVASARQRLFGRMADEATRCLDEGIVGSPEAVDLATVFGMGFPAFRGGLCRWMAARRG